MLDLQNCFVLQQELLVNQCFSSRSQAILLEGGNFLADEVPYHHAPQRGEAIDDGAAHAGNVLLERLRPGLVVWRFEFDCVNELLRVIV